NTTRAPTCSLTITRRCRLPEQRETFQRAQRSIPKMLELDTKRLSMALGVELLFGFTCATLIGRWVWREATRYAHARSAIRKILNPTVPDLESHRTTQKRAVRTEQNTVVN